MINLELNIAGPPSDAGDVQRNAFGQLPAILESSVKRPVIQNGEPVQLRLVDGPVDPSGGVFATSPATDRPVGEDEISIDIFVENVASTGGRYYLRVSSATSGALVVGRRYEISSFLAGDDFTNVGAGANTTGTVFTATGTTPTTWSHSSIVKEITLNIDYNAPLTQPGLDPSLTALMSGTLVIGNLYIIDGFMAGDDFSNIGGTNVSGFAFVATGDTPTTWTNYSILRQLTTVQDILNATGAISSAGGVQLSQASLVAINALFLSNGVRVLISGDSSNLAPSGTTITSEVIRAGTSALTEIQQITFTIPNVGSVTDLTPLPDAAASVTEIQAGDTDHASIQRITLDPPPVGGSFSFLIGVSPADQVNKMAVWNLSEDGMFALVGTDYSVVKSAFNAWDFQWVANGAQDPITVVTDGLIVPIGLSGEVDMDADVLAELQAFFGTLTPVMRVNYTPSGGTERKLLSTPTSILS